MPSILVQNAPTGVSIRASETYSFNPGQPPPGEYIAEYYIDYITYRFFKNNNQIHEFTDNLTGTPKSISESYTYIDTAVVSGQTYDYKVQVLIGVVVDQRPGDRP